MCSPDGCDDQEARLKVVGTVEGRTWRYVGSTGAASCVWHKSNKSLSVRAMRRGKASECPSIQDYKL